MGELNCLSWALARYPEHKVNSDRLLSRLLVYDNILHTRSPPPPPPLRPPSFLASFSIPFPIAFIAFTELLIGSSHADSRTETQRQQRGNRRKREIETATDDINIKSLPVVFPPPLFFCLHHFSASSIRLLFVFLFPAALQMIGSTVDTMLKQINSVSLYHLSRATALS